MIAIPLSSPCPRRPNRPMTRRHGVVVKLITPMRKSHSFCSEYRRTAITRRWLRNGTSMLMHVVSSNSPRESVHAANSHRWSELRQYVQSSTVDRSTGSRSDEQMLRGGASTNGELYDTVPCPLSLPPVVQTFSAADAGPNPVRDRPARAVVSDRRQLE